MWHTLSNTNATRWQRIEAALGLSWRRRVDRGQGIDVPCLAFGKGSVLFAILPAECFVGYQLAGTPGAIVATAGVVLFGVLAGEQVAGIPGMFFSVPVIAILRVIYVRAARERRRRGPVATPPVDRGAELVVQSQD